MPLRLLDGFKGTLQTDGYAGYNRVCRENGRCQPWRAKRRLVDPSSREAALFSRRALRQRGNKVGLRTRRPVIGSQVRSSNELAKLLRSAW
ncbi:IS66 family transposase [Thiolapillus sp.]|uniref:IS66 family transposase n=1 Tax=Thiolapillus sp. TaxID=2017437 RepID=UPI003AF44544